MYEAKNIRTMVQHRTVDEQLLMERGCPHVVGFIGAIGAGKSAAADVLLARGYRTLSFAAPLKEMVAGFCRKYFGISPLHFTGNQEWKSRPIPALGGVSGRRVLELVGTDGWREAYPDVWIDASFATCAPEAYYVIEDVRYLNEAEAIRRRGGRLIQIHRRGHSPERTGHASDNEWPLIKPDYIGHIADGDLDSLEDFVLHTVGIKG